MRFSWKILFLICMTSQFSFGFKRTEAEIKEANQRYSEKNKSEVVRFTLIANTIIFGTAGALGYGITRYTGSGYLKTATIITMTMIPTAIATFINLVNAYSYSRY